MENPENMPVEGQNPETPQSPVPSQAPAPVPEFAPVPEAPKPKSKAKLFIVLGLILAVIAAALVYFFFMRTSPEDEAPPSLSLQSGGLQGFIGVDAPVKMKLSDGTLAEVVGEFLEIEASDVKTDSEIAALDAEFGDPLEVGSATMIYFLDDTKRIDVLERAVIDTEDVGMLAYTVTWEPVAGLSEAEKKVTPFHLMPDSIFGGLEIAPTTASINDPAPSGMIQTVYLARRGTKDESVLSGASLKIYGAIDGTTEPDSFTLDKENAVPGSWHLVAAPHDELEAFATECANHIGSIWYQTGPRFGQFERADLKNFSVDPDYYLAWIRLHSYYDYETCAPRDSFPSTDETLADPDDIDVLPPDHTDGTELATAADEVMLKLDNACGEDEACLSKLILSTYSEQVYTIWRDCRGTNDTIEAKLECFSEAISDLSDEELAQTDSTVTTVDMSASATVNPPEGATEGATTNPPVSAADSLMVDIDGACGIDVACLTSIINSNYSDDVYTIWKVCDMKTEIIEEKLQCFQSSIADLSAEELAVTNSEQATVDMSGADLTLSDDELYAELREGIYECHFKEVYLLINDSGEYVRSEDCIEEMLSHYDYDKVPAVENLVNSCPSVSGPDGYNYKKNQLGCQQFGLSGLFNMPGPDPVALKAATLDNLQSCDYFGGDCTLNAFKYSAPIIAYDVDSCMSSIHYDTLNECLARRLDTYFSETNEVIANQEFVSNLESKCMESNTELEQRMCIDTLVFDSTIKVQEQWYKCIVESADFASAYECLKSNLSEELFIPDYNSGVVAFPQDDGSLIFSFPQEYGSGSPQGVVDSSEPDTQQSELYSTFKSEVEACADSACVTAVVRNYPGTLQIWRDCRRADESTAVQCLLDTAATLSDEELMTSTANTVNLGG